MYEQKPRPSSAGLFTKSCRNSGEDIEVSHESQGECGDGGPLTHKPLGATWHPADYLEHYSVTDLVMRGEGR